MIEPDYTCCICGRVFRDGDEFVQEDRKFGTRLETGAFYEDEIIPDTFCTVCYDLFLPMRDYQLFRLSIRRGRKE